MPGGRKEATALEETGAADDSTAALPLTRRLSKRASAPAGGRATAPAPAPALEAESPALSLEARLEPAKGAATADAGGGRGCEDEDEEAEAEAEEEAEAEAAEAVEKSPTWRTFLLERDASSTLSAEGVSALSSSSPSSSL